MTDIQIQNAKDISAEFLKILVHGPSGSGKTRLCTTTGGKTLVINAEGGMISIGGEDIDFFKISKIDDLRKIYQFLSIDVTYDWVCLDSISEIGEIVLSQEMKATKDPRKAYGEMQQVIGDLIRLFRDLPKNIYFSAKQERIKDEVSGQIFWGPSMPGQKLGPSMPYFFDVVCAARVRLVDGKHEYFLQTQRDEQYEAKHRVPKHVERPH